MNQSTSIISKIKAHVGSWWKSATPILITIIAILPILGIVSVLICLIPNDSLQDIFKTMAAGAIGGVCTLLGVSWTIGKGNEEKKNDLIRIEKERKEEERKKHIPYIKIASDLLANYDVNARVYNRLDLDDPIQRKILKENVFYAIHIDDFIIKNVSSSNIIIIGVVVNKDVYWIENKMLLEKNATCMIKTTGNSWINLASLLQHFSIILEDVLENVYEVECTFDLTPSNTETIECGPDDEIKLTGYFDQYLITNTMLPKLTNLTKEHSI